MLQRRSPAGAGAVAAGVGGAFVWWILSDAVPNQFVFITPYCSRWWSRPWRRRACAPLPWTACDGARASRSELRRAPRRRHDATPAEGGAARPPRRRAQGGDDPRARRPVRPRPAVLGPGRAALVLRPWRRQPRHPPLPRHLPAHRRRAPDPGGARTGRGRGRHRPRRGRGRVRRAPLRAPELHTDGGLGLDAVVEAVDAGATRGMALAGAAGRAIAAHTIVCAMRTGSRSAQIAGLAVRLEGPSAPASSRSTWPGPRPATRPACTSDALDIAGRGLLRLTIHASEPPGLDLIADALACGRSASATASASSRAARSTPTAGCASVRWRPPSGSGRSPSSWLRRATSRSAPYPPSPIIPSPHSCAPGSSPPSTPTTG